MTKRVKNDSDPMADSLTVRGGKLVESSCSFGAVRRNRFPIMLCDPAVGGTVVG